MKNVKAKHDHLIDAFVKDSNYTFESDGTVKNSKGKILGFQLKNEVPTRRKGYTYIRYKGKNLKKGRVIFRKFHGPLDCELVIDHIDGNSLNDHPDNLTLTTQEINAYRALDNRKVG